MSRTYYVIELTAGWLAVLLVVLAVLMVLAFAGGYGAAWSVLGGEPEYSPVAEAGDRASAMETVDVESPDPEGIVPSVATPVPAEPTVTPAPGFARPQPSPTAQSARPTPTPKPAATARPTVAVPAPTAVVSDGPASDGVFWVQVLASGSMSAIERARGRLEESGFPNENHKIVRTRVAGGTTLLKLRIGPFPDRASADRVMLRMQRAGFPDAWVVKP